MIIPFLDGLVRDDVSRRGFRLAVEERVLRRFMELERWRRILDLVAHLPRHRRMMKAVAGPDFEVIRSRQPKLAIKYLNPRHIANGLSSSDRAEAMIHHYSVLRDAFDPIVLNSILGSGVLLWETGTESTRHTLSLVFSHPTDNEGELTIEYAYAHVPVHVLSFTLVPWGLVGGQTGTVLLVSRLQGMRVPNEERRAALKSLHGLSPPALLIAALQGIAIGLGLDRIVGVSAERQVCLEPGDTRMKAAYDEFFFACGASEGDGFLTIDLPIEERPLAATKSSNRARVRAQRDLKREVAISAKSRLGLEPVDYHRTAMAGQKELAALPAD